MSHLLLHACRGALPAIVGMFTSLRYFDGSNNSFSGTISGNWSDAGIVRLVCRAFTFRPFIYLSNVFILCLAPLL